MTSTHVDDNLLLTRFSRRLSATDLKEAELNNQYLSRLEIYDGYAVQPASACITTYKTTQITTIDESPESDINDNRSRDTDKAAESSVAAIKSTDNAVTANNARDDKNDKPAMTNTLNDATNESAPLLHVHVGSVNGSRDHDADILSTFTSYKC